MGAELSSCCGVTDDARETQADVTSSIPDGVGKDTVDSNPVVGEIQPYDVNEVSQFKKVLYDGLDVNLLLQDKTMMKCRVRLDVNEEFILLLCERRAREIGFKDLKAILSTEEELKRVETAAGITDSTRCAALHLAESGNCIPVFFCTSNDKDMFVFVLNGILKAHVQNN